MHRQCGGLGGSGRGLGRARESGSEKRWAGRGEGPHWQASEARSQRRPARNGARAERACSLHAPGPPVRADFCARGVRTRRFVGAPRHFVRAGRPPPRRRERSSLARLTLCSLPLAPTHTHSHSYSHSHKHTHTHSRAQARNWLASIVSGAFWVSFSWASPNVSKNAHNQGPQIYTLTPQALLFSHTHTHTHPNTIDKSGPGLKGAA